MVKVADRHDICYIFEKGNGKRASETMFLAVWLANTQIQHMTKCQKDQTCSIFLKRGFFKDIKNDNSMSQTYTYTNTQLNKFTDTQIHKYTYIQLKYMAKWQRDPTRGIFFKRGLFMDIFCVLRSFIMSSYDSFLCWSVPKMV